MLVGLVFKHLPSELPTFTNDHGTILHRVPAVRLFVIGGLFAFEIREMKDAIPAGHERQLAPFINAKDSVLSLGKFHRPHRSHFGPIKERGDLRENEQKDPENRRNHAYSTDLNEAVHEPVNPQDALGNLEAVGIRFE